VRGDAAIFALLALALVPAVLGQPYYFLLPMIADSVLGVGAWGLGLLAAAPGIGSVLAVATLATLGDFHRKGAVMLGGAIGFGSLLMLFAQSQWLWLSCLLLLFVGAAQTGYNAINHTLLQKLTPDAYRGRVLSLLLLDRGMVPLARRLLACWAICGARRKPCSQWARFARQWRWSLRYGCHGCGGWSRSRPSAMPWARPRHRPPADLNLGRHDRTDVRQPHLDAPAGSPVTERERTIEEHRVRRIANAIDEQHAGLAGLSDHGG
jgi:hypothetical protein